MRDLTLPLAIFALGVSLLLGGAAAPYLFSDSLTEALCLPVLIIALAGLSPARIEPAGRVALILAIIVVAIPALQLIPLPPSIWAALPGRDWIAGGFDLAGVERPWEAWSVTPRATRWALLSLIPPLTVLLLTLRLDGRARRACAAAIVGVACVSLALGFLQLAQGPDSPLRFFAFTNVDDMVGFFANRNHFAALVYASMPMAAALLLGAAMDPAPALRGPAASRRWMGATALAAALALCVAGLLSANSRAAVAIGALAIVVCLSLAAPALKRSGAPRIAAIGGGLLALAAFAAIELDVFRLLQRFSNGVDDEGRAKFAEIGRRVFEAYFPAGAGVGSFERVYAAMEAPRDSFDTIVNRAHFDLLEWGIENGVIAYLVLAAALVWLAWANVRVWRRPYGPTAADASLARACAAIPLLLLLHCFVDYPLRTIALMSVGAFCIGVCVKPVEAPPSGATRDAARKAT